MAITVHALGACKIKVDTGASHALEDLGYSDDGVQVEERGMYHDIPGDQNGGEGGVPIEKQYLGEFHIVRFTLTSFDKLILPKVTTRIYGGTAGTMGTPGTLMSSNCFRLLLWTPQVSAVSTSRNYLVAMPIDSIPHNRGAKATRYSMVFACYPNSTNVIYNAVDS